MTLTVAIPSARKKYEQVALQRLAKGSELGEKRSPRILLKHWCTSSWCKDLDQLSYLRTVISEILFDIICIWAS